MSGPRRSTWYHCRWYRDTWYDDGGEYIYVTDSSKPESTLDWLVGIPLLVVIGAVAVVVLPPILLARAFITTICPKCHIPVARKILATTFDRENVKFNVDHYRVLCACRWCGSRWGYEKLLGADLRRDEGGALRGSPRVAPSVQFDGPAILDSNRSVSSVCP